MDLLDSLGVVGGLLLVLLAILVAFVGRRRFLSRRSGTFDCSLRTTTQRLGNDWTLGLARYEADRIEWFRVFDLSLRPRKVLRRSGMAVQGRRHPAGPEALSLMSGFVVVRCTYERGSLELAMSEQSYTGFASWLEAAPPGQNVIVV